MKNEQTTHQIPTFILDTPQLILSHNSPNAVGNDVPILQGEIQLDFIADFVIQFDETPEGLVGPLEEIVTWT